MASACPPAARISDATADRLPGVRPPRIRRKPRLPRRRAIAAPMPDPAPVITATRGELGCPAEAPDDVCVMGGSLNTKRPPCRGACPAPLCRAAHCLYAACDAAGTREYTARMQRSNRSATAHVARTVRAACLGLTVGSALVCAASNASADSGALPSVSWQAPPECPDAGALSSRLELVLGAELSEYARDWQV